MLARKPLIDLNSTPVVWSRIPEFSLYWNGVSVVIPYVEHYLIGVTQEIMNEHCAGNEKLKQELEIFIDQERNHSNYHIQFNKRMFDAGYTELKAFIKTVQAELRELRENRSLAFNIGYCAGFENAATFSSQYVFGAASDLFEGADPAGADLVMWHVSEEFEHKAVCHDAFKQVSGNYFMRLWGLFYSFWHINDMFNRAAELVFTEWRKGLSAAEIADSKRRHMKLVRRQLAYVLPRSLPLLLPGFDPNKVKPSPRTLAALKFYNTTQALPPAERFGVTVGQSA